MALNIKYGDKYKYEIGVDEAGKAYVRKGL